MFSAPSSTAPAASSRSISFWSCAEGASSRLIFDPARVGRPFTSNRFLTANGTPAREPFLFPLSTAAARLRARSTSTSVNELSTGSRCVMRASASSTTAAAETRPAVTAAAISPAVAQAESNCGSGLEDRCGLGIVRQLLLGHKRGELECDIQVGADFALPFRLDRNAERLRGGIDVGVERGGRLHERSTWVSTDDSARKPALRRYFFGQPERRKATRTYCNR